MHECFLHEAACPHTIETFEQKTWVITGYDFTGSQMELVVAPLHNFAFLVLYFNQ